MTAWLDKVKLQHEEGKKTNPDYSYKQAMIDASGKKNGSKKAKKGSRKAKKGSKKSKKCCPCDQHGGEMTTPSTPTQGDGADEKLPSSSQSDQVGGKHRRRRNSSKHKRNHGSLFHHVTKRGGKGKKRKGRKTKKRRGGVYTK